MFNSLSSTRVSLPFYVLYYAAYHGCGLIVEPQSHIDPYFFQLLEFHHLHPSIGGIKEVRRCQYFIYTSNQKDSIWQHDRKPNKYSTHAPREAEKRSQPRRFASKFRSGS